METNNGARGACEVPELSSGETSEQHPSTLRLIQVCSASKSSLSVITKRLTYLERKLCFETRTVLHLHILFLKRALQPFSYGVRIDLTIVSSLTRTRIYKAHGLSASLAGIVIIP